MHWRKLIRVLHRDVGYFLTGLVVMFSVSGIAVNHVDDWNPSYARAESTVDVGPLPTGDLDAMETVVRERIPLDEDEVTGRRRASPTQFVVFLKGGGDVTLDPATGRGTMLRVSTRPFIFETNVLHLNHLKGVWTYVSDCFSLLLIGLALTGLFMLKGRRGLWGRGKWFVAGGLVLPVGFLIYYYSTR